jgi:hypothetical protein
MQLEVIKYSYTGKKLPNAEKLKHADKRKRSLAQPQQQQQQLVASATQALRKCLMSKKVRVDMDMSYTRVLHITVAHLEGHK